MHRGRVVNEHIYSRFCSAARFAPRPTLMLRFLHLPPVWLAVLMAVGWGAARLHAPLSDSEMERPGRGGADRRGAGADNMVGVVLSAGAD